MSGFEPKSVILSGVTKQEVQMAHRSDSQTQLVGGIHVADRGESLPMLWVRAVAVDSGARLAETISAADGAFGIVLPLGGASIGSRQPGRARGGRSKRKLAGAAEAAESNFHMPVLVQALDGQGMLLAEAR